MAMFPVMMGKGDFYKYKIGQSCRFNSADSAYLSRVNAGGNNDRGTFSWWMKLVDGDSYSEMFNCAQDSDDYFVIRFSSTRPYVYTYQEKGGVADMGCGLSTQSLRDVSSWQHIVVAINTNEVTDTDRVKTYVNGVQQVHDATTYPAQGAYIHCNQADTPMYIGGDTTVGFPYFDGYMAEVNYVDALQLTPSDFGQFKNGIWVPKKYTGVYGNNGHYLDFADSADLGNDVSGNNNDFTSSGLTAADQVEDSPTNNYCTMNPLNVLDSDFVTTDVSDGNLKYVASHNAGATVYSTIEVPTTGKWYIEWTVSGVVSAFGNYVGLSTGDLLYAANGQANNGSWIAYGDAWSNGDVIALSYDTATGIGNFYRNNVDQGALQAPGTIPIQKPIRAASTDAGMTFEVNFGQSGFTYTPPVGYKALSTKNLPEPNKNIFEGEKGFEPALYEGTGAEQSISSLKFSPDMVWTKNRETGGSHHRLYDSVRGVNTSVYPNLTAVEAVVANSLTSFDSNGFTLGNAADSNQSGQDFVAWCWKEDPIYGFDIVSYTGTGVAHTEAHNLGVVPEMMIVKNRDSVQDWTVYHKGLNGGVTPEQYVLLLNDTSAELNNLSWNDTAPTSSVFTVSTLANVNNSGEELIAYLWASIEGYSKVFSYTGNGLDDGTFTYCGFRPAYLIGKRVDVAGAWYIWDASRDTYNVTAQILIANDPAAESTGGNSVIDFISNGVKARGATSSWNASGGTYICMAFAEHPFKYANAR